MLNRLSMLRLRDKTPLAQGDHRALYAVESDPTLVVKVIRATPAPPRNPVKRLKRICHRVFPLSQDRSLLREYAAYMRLKRAQLERTDEPPVADWAGPVATDIGLGMLYEKIGPEDGTIGPSVSALARSGKLPEYLPLLNDFVRRLFEWEIRANDVNRGNIVLGTRHGREQFVLVDGLGDSHFIPVRTWFGWWNEYSLNKRLAKVAARTHLTWDPNERRFLLKD